MNVVPVGDTTWADCGDSDVGLLGLYDKRQCTILPAIAANGDLVGFQVILEGTTTRSLPTGPGFDKLKELGVHVTFSSNHWSNFETMKQFFDSCLVPHAC